MTKPASSARLVCSPASSPVSSELLVGDAAIHVIDSVIVGSHDHAQPGYAHDDRVDRGRGSGSSRSSLSVPANCTSVGGGDRRPYPLRDGASASQGGLGVTCQRCTVKDAENISEVGKGRLSAAAPQEQSLHAPHISTMSILRFRASEARDHPTLSNPLREPTFEFLSVRLSRPWIVTWPRGMRRRQAPDPYVPQPSEPIDAPPGVSL